MSKRVALVVGGSDGIGWHVSLGFLRQGHRVAVMSRSQEKLGRFAAEAGSLGEVVTFQGDATDSGRVAEVVGELADRWGRIDILINCQGGSLGLKADIEDIPEDKWGQLLAANLTSVFLCCKHVIPLMKRQRWGRIINLSSIAGRGNSFFGSTAYAAAKAGVIGFTRQATVELGPYNITMNVVAPGVTATERIKNFWANKSDDERRRFFDRVPLKRLGEPEESAAAVLFLASEEAGYITGAVIDVNGGYFVG